MVIQAIKEVVDEYDLDKYETVFIHGACPKGLDKQVADLAEQWGVEAEAYPANWDAFGKSAGFKRNQQMVDHGADVCLAFIRNNSNGATHTANLAKAAGIRTIVYREW